MLVVVGFVGVLDCGVATGLLVVVGFVGVLGAELLLADGEEYVKVSRLGVEKVVFDGACVLGAEVVLLGAELLFVDEEGVYVSRLDDEEEVVLEEEDELDLDDVLDFDGALDLCGVLGLEYELLLVLYELVGLIAIINTSFQIISQFF